MGCFCTKNMEKINASFRPLLPFFSTLLIFSPLFLNVSQVERQLHFLTFSLKSVFFSLNCSVTSIFFTHFLSATHADYK